MRIILQILLVVVILTGGVYFLFNNHTKAKAYKKILAIVAVILLILAALFPSTSDAIAHFLGIERGADLILYLAIFSILYLMLSQSLYKKRVAKREARLVRKLAILEEAVKRPEESQDRYKA
ncbi:MAG: DUF2304 domain-containing protein [Coriobacteriaceae bacterium]|jgi:hypothetical protein|nr:DUF2304 domain-containing protein [Coriobacteriaceae bacterium]